MLPDIWTPDLTVVFAGSVADEFSDTLGFYHLHPRDRFWELLEIGGVAPKRVITPQEGKALADGHKDGSLSDPVRSIFIQKKTSQLLQLGIGLTDLNRRMSAADEKDRTARPSADDVDQFLTKTAELRPRMLAFVATVDLFVQLFADRFPGMNDALGLQTVKIGTAEVWLLGSTRGRPRGEALTRQEDAFFALGERYEAFRKGLQES